MKRVQQPGKLWSRVNSSKPLLHFGVTWIGKNYELIIIAVLMSATKGKTKTIIAYRKVASPILNGHLIGLNIALS